MGRLTTRAKAIQVMAWLKVPEVWISEWVGTMDSEKATEFEQGYEAGISYACRWIEQYMDARKGRLEPGKNQRKRDELEHIKKTLIRYIDPKRQPT